MFTTMRPDRVLVGLVAGLLLAASTLTAQEAAVEGAVYAMTNAFDGNAVVGYTRAPDGSLTPIGSFSTGGDGAAFDGGEGLDPLISAYALMPTDDYRFVLAVNAGSDTISVMRVNEDYSLTLTDQVSTLGVGPNSVAYHAGLVYVSNIDADGVFNGEPDQEGNLAGFRLTAEGRLRRVPRSVQALGNRPSAIRFSNDGRHLIVTSINAGSSALASGSTDEIVVYRVRRDGRLAPQPTAATASTFPGNAANRNLPSAIGFDVVEDQGKEYVVVTEAREFQADGAPPAFPQLQTGSVSTWRLESNGLLTAINLDVLAGDSATDGQRTACWIDFSSDGSIFWVSNALEATLSTFSFDQGVIGLINEVSAAGTGPAPGDPFGTTEGWIDLWVSPDGNTLYQLFGLDGAIGVFDVGPDGLTLIQEVGGLPETNTQGIVAIGRPRLGGVYAMANAPEGNSIVAYAQGADGRLSLIEDQATGGLGANFDGGEGLDPLISAYAVLATPDGQHLFAVNAGSGTVSSFRVNGDYSLAPQDTESTLGVGPNSIAYANGVIYVSNIDADGVFAGEPDQEGSLIGYRVNRRGGLQPIADSRRVLANRPSAIQFSPDGRFLIVASINAGSSALASGSTDELVVYAVDEDGNLSAAPVAAATSTLPGNAEGRNLPSAIGFEIVERGGVQYVIVTEAREFRPDGSPPILPGLQTGSVSSWRLEANGDLTAMQLDVLAGTSFTDGQRTACWIEFSRDGSVFWVSNALESTLSTFSFVNGTMTLVEEVSAQGNAPQANDPFGTTDGWIDLWLSSDGKYLYQLFGLAGTVGVFEVTDAGLVPVQEATGNLPVVNTQGIVALSQLDDRAAFAGNGSDLRLLTSLNDEVPDAIDTVAAEGTDKFNLRMESASGGLAGAAAFLGAELFATGGALPEPIGNGIFLSPAFSPVLAPSGFGAPVLPNAGINLSFNLVPQLAGSSLIFQGAVISQGSLVLTDAHVLEIR